MSKLTEYLQDTKTELKHVVWPSRNQVFFYTLVVLVLSALVAYYLGFFDFVFSLGLAKLLAL